MASLRSNCIAPFLFVWALPVAMDTPDPASLRILSALAFRGVYVPCWLDIPLDGAAFSEAAEAALADCAACTPSLPRHRLFLPSPRPARPAPHAQCLDALLSSLEGYARAAALQAKLAAGARELNFGRKWPYRYRSSGR
eukprot:tig00000900_g5354.t1